MSKSSLRRSLRFLVVFSLTCAALLAMRPAKALPPVPYTFTGMRGNLIDADTGKPVGGVLALVYWRNLTPGHKNCSMTGGCVPNCEELINVVSTSSDTQGRLVIPAWSNKWGRCAYMPSDQPQILLYKPGYETRVLSNDEAGESKPSIPTASRSNWDGQTIKMYALGPHRYSHWMTRSGDLLGIYFVDDPGDNYATNLQRYSAALETPLAEQFWQDEEDTSPRCFWQDLRPAMLLLLQEKVRLQNYTNAGSFHLFDASLSDKTGGTTWSCGDQSGYIKGLQAQADKLTPEPLSYSFAVPHSPNSAGEYQIRGPHEQPARPVQRPADPQTPSAEALLAGSKAPLGIVYRVRLDSQNPNFVTVTMLVPRGKQVDTGEDPAQWQGTVQANPYLHGYYCDPIYDTEPDRTGNIPQRQLCNWVAALDPTTASSPKPLFYDFTIRTWILSDVVLRRPRGIEGPEYLQLVSPLPVTVSTALTPAGDKLWILPAGGLPFTLKIVPNIGG